MPAHPSCVLQWMLLRRYGNVFVPKTETHACSWRRSLLWSAIQLVSDNRANKTIQHTPIRSALERFFQPVLWSASVVHGSSLSSTARSLKVAVFLMPTAAEVVGVKGICSGASVGRGTFSPTIFADVPRSSLFSLRTKRNATWFAWLEICIRVAKRAVRVWFCADELEEDIAHSRSFAQCPFRPQARHSVFRLQFFQSSSKVSDDRCDGRTGYLPLPLPFALPLPFPLSFPKEK